MDFPDNPIVPQDADFTRLVGHDHRKCAHDVERCDYDDEKEYHPHAQLLELERLKERLVLLLPVLHAYTAFHVHQQAVRDLWRPISICRTHFEAGDVVRESGKPLRCVEVHIRISRIVFVQPSLENAGDDKRVDAHRNLPGRCVHLIGQSRDERSVAGKGVQVRRENLSDNHPGQVTAGWLESKITNNGLRANGCDIRSGCPVGFNANDGCAFWISHL